jgi:hypothetical protein
MFLRYLKNLYNVFYHISPLTQVGIFVLIKYFVAIT